MQFKIVVSGGGGDAPSPLFGNEFNKNVKYKEMNMHGVVPFPTFTRK